MEEMDQFVIFFQFSSIYYFFMGFIGFVDYYATSILIGEFLEAEFSECGNGKMVGKLGKYPKNANKFVCR